MNKQTSKISTTVIAIVSIIGVASGWAWGLGPPPKGSGKKFVQPF